MIIEMMSGRVTRLVQVIEGYKKTGIPLLGFNGTSFFPGEKAESPGIYLIIPFLARLFHLDLNQAIHLFIVGTVWCSFAIGLIGLWFLYPSPLARTGSVLNGLLLAFIALCSYDVYIAYSSVVFAVLPWHLLFLKNESRPRVHGAFLVAAGAAATLASYVRMHAGTPLLIFITISITLFPRLSWRRKGASLACLAAGVVLPVLLFSTILERRDQFLRKAQPQETYEMKGNYFWHLVYIGLDFLSNEYGTPNSDVSVANKVRQRDSSIRYLSKEYNQEVKKEVLDLVRHHPYFVVRTVFAKIGVLIFYFLVVSNLGLFGILFRQKPLWITLSFVSSLAFSALSGLLVNPYHFYMLGFMAFGCLWGIAGLEVDS